MQRHAKGQANRGETEYSRFNRQREETNQSFYGHFEIKSYSFLSNVTASEDVSLAIDNNYCLFDRRSVAYR